MKTTRALAAAMILCAGGPTLAVDGVIEINQARALAGGVTATDTPGFPVTIDQRGSYRLTSNLEVAGSEGILIVDSYVTLDLNGFVVRGNSQGGSSANGIRSTHVNAKIVNGRVQLFAGQGLDLEDQAWVENLAVSDNGTTGIRVFDDSVVRNCQVMTNGGRGVWAGENANIIGNTVHNSGSVGIRVDGGVVTHNTVTSSGNLGVQAELPTLVTANTVVDSTSAGLGLCNGCGYSNNVLANTTNVSGGVQMGPNLCGNSLCP